MGKKIALLGIRKKVCVCAAVRSGGTGLGRRTRNVFPPRSYCVKTLAVGAVKKLQHERVCPLGLLIILHVALNTWRVVSQSCVVIECEV